MKPERRQEKTVMDPLEYKHWKLPESHFKLNLKRTANRYALPYYRKSKKLFSAPCYDLDMDRPPHSCELNLARCKQDLKDTERRLERKVKEATIRRNELNVQWRDLELLESQLKDNFVRFNRFVRGNETKRQRAEMKRLESIKLKESKTEENRMLKEKNELLQKVCKNLIEAIKSFKIYEEFVLAAKEQGNFKSVKHMLDAYSVMSEAKESSALRNAYLVQSYSDWKGRYEKMIEQHYFESLHLRQTVTDLKRRYDVANKTALMWDTTITEVCKWNTEWYRRMANAKSAIQYLDQHIHYWRKTKQSKKTTEQSMLHIKQTLESIQFLQTEMYKLHEPKLSLPTTKRVVKLTTKPRVVDEGQAVYQQVLIKLGTRDQESPSAYEFPSMEKMIEKMQKKEDAVVTPVKLSPRKFRYGNVRDFEERYRAAVADIAAQKLVTISAPDSTAESENNQATFGQRRESKVTISAKESSHESAPSENNQAKKPKSMVKTRSFTFGDSKSKKMSAEPSFVSKSSSAVQLLPLLSKDDPKVDLQDLARHFKSACLGVKENVGQQNTIAICQEDQSITPRKSITLVRTEPA